MSWHELILLVAIVVCGADLISCGVLAVLAQLERKEVRALATAMLELYKDHQRLNELECRIEDLEHERDPGSEPAGGSR